MATKDWYDVGEQKFRKLEVYDMLWDSLSLDRYLVAMAPFGGPIATIRDPKKAHKLAYHDDDIANPRLRIWSSAGSMMAEISWKSNGSLVGMGWSDQEELICVVDDGGVFKYDLHGQLAATYSLGPECKSKKVANCLIWPGGLVARTAQSSDLFLLTDFADPKPVRCIARLNGLVPASMTLIDPSRSLSGGVEILLSRNEGSIVVVDEKQAQDMQLSSGPFSHMAVSPSGEFVACFSDSGTLYWYSTDFRENVAKFETGSETPLDLAWCGDDAVVIYWPGILLLVGRNAEFVKYSFDSQPAMVSECDGLRIVSSEKCEFLQSVPPSLEEILHPTKSGEPAALLFFSFEEYEDGNADADETLRQIDRDTQLEDAVLKCLDAASHEFDQELQRKLLRAASYGALFCGASVADEFVDRCRTIRLLNAVRHTDIGIPLTFSQFERLDADVLIDRLINRHHHLVAMRICEYLRIPPARVLAHWAIAKIRTSEEQDDKLGNQIIAKLANYDGISYSEIATAADKEGRRPLATMLLDCEPRAEEQVPLLISMDEVELALSKAVDSFDTDLIHMVLLHIRRVGTETELFDAVKPYPLARAVLVSHYRRHDVALLKSYYYHLRQSTEAAHNAVLEAYQQEKWADRVQILDIAASFYRKEKEAAFFAQVTADQVKLLEEQKRREAEPDCLQPVVDMSLAEMLEADIAAGHVRKATAVAKTFNVPEKRFWHIQVRALARAHAWEELSKLAKTKKTPPIGWLPFVEACYDEGARNQAAEYVMHLETHEKLTWLCNLGMFREAVEVAAAEHDQDALRHIRSLCRQPAIEQMIDGLLR